jgi:trk system potassium uptake protein TrkH
MLAAFAVSMFYGEAVMMKSLLMSAGITFLAGVILGLLSGRDMKIRLRESFVIIAVCWIAMSLMGALPFWLSGVMESFVDCVFESVSGFTTTAASVLVNTGSAPKGLLFWRSLSLWVGGMGVLVLLTATALISWGEGGTQNLMAENPGPVPGKLVPKLKNNARIIYSVYIGLTALETILLSAGGMPLFDSVLTAMATAGTGGFTIHNASVAAYGSLYIETVITVFMFMCGVNFNIYFFLLVRAFADIRKNEELKVYIGIVLGASLLVALNLSAGGAYPSFFVSLRHSVFQVVSIMSTTGFLTADVALWPSLSRIILFFLMLIGACAGSSAGGLKIARVVLLFKEVKRALFRVIRPRAVTMVKLDGKAVDRYVLHAANAYIVAYFILFALSFIVISADNIDFEGSATVVAACMNNIGAGLGLTDTGKYALFSPLSKLVLMFDMLLGRLEIYPVLLLFSPRTWRHL